MTSEPTFAFSDVVSTASVFSLADSPAWKLACPPLKEGRFPARNHMSGLARHATDFFQRLALEYSQDHLGLPTRIPTFVLSEFHRHLQLP